MRATAVSVRAISGFCGFVLALLLVSCGGGGGGSGGSTGDGGSTDTTAPSALVGTWIYLEITAGGNFDHTWTFDATNGYTYQAARATGTESCENTGSYALSGNTLTYTVSTQTNSGLICEAVGVSRTGTIVISATSFTLTEDGSDMSVTYTKQ